MKKLILLLSLQMILSNAFSQTLDFRENFENGVFTNDWKIVSGKWYIADLKDKAIRPPAGDNDFALASAGSGEISVDIPVQKDDLEIPLQLGFTYWVHSKGSTGHVSVVFLDERGEMLSTTRFDVLQQKDNWEIFNQEFKAPMGTVVIRLKFAEVATTGGNTMYLKSISYNRRKRER